MFSSFSNSASLSNQFGSLATYRTPATVVINFPTGTQIIGKSGITFPQSTLTTNSVTVSNLMYGAISVSGTYIATSSSAYTLGYSSGLSFNSTTSTMWASTPNVYSTSTGLYTGSVSTLISGTAHTGEYVQIQCPFSFIMKSWSCGPHISANTEYAKSVFIAGSTDGSTWNLLGNVLATSYTTNTISLSSNTTSYKYYRFVVNKMTTGDVIACMSLITFSS